MKAALYAGAFFTADATGNALAAKLRALQARGFETRIYTAYSEAPYGPITRVVNGADEARADAWRRGANVHLFEFGGYYPLFELIDDVAPPARAIVTFHGLTPREYWPADSLAIHERSLAQLAVAGKADRLLCASAYSRDFLVRRGIDPRRIRIVPLPLSLPRVKAEPCSDGRLRLLFVGRMARSKGLPDLLRALATFRETGFGGWELSIVSNPATAAQGFGGQMRELAAQLGLESRLRWLGKIEDRTAMAKLYAQSSALVVPTYHDTFCLPALEALACGCPVVAYASGAVPEVTGGLAQIVPTGDVAMLAAGIRRIAQALPSDRVPVAGGRLLPRKRFARHARALAARLDERRFAKTLIRTLSEACGRRFGAHTRLAAALEQYAARWRR